MDSVTPTVVKPVVLYQRLAYHIGNGYCPFLPPISFPQLVFVFNGSCSSGKKLNFTETMDS